MTEISVNAHNGPARQKVDMAQEERSLSFAAAKKHLNNQWDRFMPALRPAGKYRPGDQRWKSPRAAHASAVYIANASGIAGRTDT
jgi:hypothetical protein